MFTGYADRPIGDDPIEPDTFRGSGTMGIALRRYKEGAGYQEVELPWQEHYFRSPPKLDRDAGQLRQTAGHWDIRPGMEPIEWVISPALAELAAGGLSGGDAALTRDLLSRIERATSPYFD